MTAPGGSEADRAARERLAREARVTATTLLDWVGTRVEGAATTRTAGADGARPRQSPGPCGWCPVCALIAAVRGEQPELTAHLAEQASALLVVLRLLIQSHAHDHPAHENPVPTGPVPTGPVAGTPAAAPSPSPAAAPSPVEPDLPADVLANPDVPWDAPHAVFDPDPAPAAAAPDGSSRPAPDRPTGKRGPRPSPRPRPVDVSTTPAAPPVPPAPAPVEPRTPTPTPTPTPLPAGRVPTATRAPAAPTRGVQRIPVRRRPRPC